MIDAGRLRALLDRLTTELSHLKRLAQLPDDELMSDGDRIAAVKYRFIVAIETCIDAGNHIIASEGLRAPSDYSDVFAVLAEAGFVPAELAPRLALMARFRNLLVHEYLAVEDERVAEVLRSSLRDLEALKTSIGRVARGGQEPE
ncbi:DUF86 domain-containing protein [soil metagenome]